MGLFVAQCLIILLSEYTVFDVITELFAYVIMGQKKRRNYRTPLDLKWRTSVTQQLRTLRLTIVDKLGTRFPFQLII